MATSVRLSVVKATYHRCYEEFVLQAREHASFKLREQFNAVLGNNLRNLLASIDAPAIFIGLTAHAILTVSLGRQKRNQFGKFAMEPREFTV